MIKDWNVKSLVGGIMIQTVYMQALECTFNMNDNNTCICIPLFINQNVLNHVVEDWNWLVKSRF